MTESNPNPASAPEASPVKRQRPWWVKLLRWGSLSVASLITLLVLVLAVDSWRGQRAWQKYRTEMEAKGVIFDLKGMIPPPVPDDDNFAMTPLLRPALDMHPTEVPDGKGGMTRWKDPAGKERLDSISTRGQMPYVDGPNGEKLPNDTHWQLGQVTDLKSWQQYYRAITNFPTPPEPGHPAADVLLALSRFDAEIAELREASRRPHARYDIAYDEEPPIAILLPHLGSIRGIAQVASLRASAELALDDQDAALADFLLALRLSDSVSAEPILISHLLRLTVFNVAIRSVWEGLMEHRWNDAHLRQIEARLARLDFITELHQAMRGERAFGNTTMEWIIRNPHMISTLATTKSVGGSSPDSMTARALGKLIPKGWMRFEQLNYNRLFDDLLLNHLPESAAELEVASLQRAAAATTEKLKEKHHPLKAITSHHVFASLLLPALETASMRSVNYQAMLNQVRVALALERHWLARGTYPETLEKLVPEFASVLPPDPVNRKPLGYSRVGDSGFKLWSVGWNLKDDGGQVVMKSRSTEAIDFERGDWVWPALAVGD